MLHMLSFSPVIYITILDFSSLIGFSSNAGLIGILNGTSRITWVFITTVALNSICLPLIFSAQKSLIHTRSQMISPPVICGIAVTILNGMFSFSENTRPVLLGSGTCVLHIIFTRIVPSVMIFPCSGVLLHSLISAFVYIIFSISPSVFSGEIISRTDDSPAVVPTIALLCSSLKSHIKSFSRWYPSTIISRCTFRYISM